MLILKSQTWFGLEVSTFYTVELTMVDVLVEKAVKNLMSVIASNSISIVEWNPYSNSQAVKLLNLDLCTVLTV